MAEVLVVDAERDLREVVSLALSNRGHAVTETASGVDALVLAARRPFDLVILDVDPDTLVGEGVARVVSDLAPAPVIATSGRRDGWAREMLAAGASACLPKPFELDDLLSLVSSILRVASEREGHWPTDVHLLVPSDLELLAQASEAALDMLPFGAIALDRAGTIVEYNAYESDASTHARSRVIGRQFSDIAPCTTVRKFAQRLERGLAGEPLDAVLRFVFPHRRALSVVSVRLYRDEIHDRVWIFVSKARSTTRASVGREVLDATQRVPPR